MGVVAVPDDRARRRSRRYIETQKVIPASVDIVDIAGLVKGASKRRRPGEQVPRATFARPTRSSWSCAASRNDDIIHVDGSVDPIRDIEVIELELILADLESLQSRLKKAKAMARGGKPDDVANLALMEKVLPLLEEGLPARRLELEGPDRARLRRMQLLSSKPVLYCCNVGEGDLPDGNAHVDKVRTRAAAEEFEVVVVCGKIEAELAELEGDEKREMLDLYGLAEPALNTLTRGCYQLLGLQSYFTAGEKEIRAWTIPIGATAPQAAGVIHSDFERGFIRANVYSLQDLETHKSEAAIKAAGKLRSEGKEYVVEDGDIVHFLFNV